MKHFTTYLQNKGFTQSSIYSYIRMTKKYLSFVKSKRISVKSATYKTVLSFVKQLQKTNNEKSTNGHLIAIRHYYNFLNVKNNPVKVKLKRKPTQISSNTMTAIELEQLYLDWIYNESKTSIRDKIVIGLFVFQGIHSYELKHIKIDDVDFNNMTITIQKSKKSNSRILKIHIKQLIDLKNYIDNIRNQFNNSSNLLIVTDKQSNCTRSILNQISKKLTKQQTSFTLIRTSNIKLWLKQHNLRKVQYLSGHKYISSTERYLTTDIEQLKQNIIKFHPL